MDDLISRSAVINLLRELRIDNVAVNDKRLVEHIEELPTAYNVDKVVEELREKFNYNSEQAEIYREGSDKDAYFREKEELYRDRANNYGVAISIVQEVEQEYGDGWIPVEDRLPEDCDSRFYMCIVEDHEEDLPMYCQYEEGYGFGSWHDYYDEHTLGFVDSEFRTNEELGYEKVIAWRQVPAYQPKGE